MAHPGSRSWRPRRPVAGLLYGTGQASDEQLKTGIAGWAIVHGIATLWLNGNLPERLGDDPEEITRAVASNLRGQTPMSGAADAAGRLGRRWHR